jgi:TrmH family RNA methyltransferase
METVITQAPALARIRIVLVRTRHPGNIGAAARAMLTMGMARLVLVAPARFPDPEAVALAAGATTVLDAACVVATLDEALAGCALAIGLSARPREYAGRVLSLRAAATEAIAHSNAGDVALVFGTEMSGLSNDELARCGIAATIPANDEFASLNVAAAVQVHASRRQRTMKSRRSMRTRGARSRQCGFSSPTNRGVCCRGCGGSSGARNWSAKR